MTLAVLGVLVLLGAAGWRVWSVWAGRRRAIAALTQECPGLADRLVGRDATLLFSAEERRLGIASHRIVRLLPFDTVRRWRAEPLHDGKGRRTGWTLILETTDPREPIWTVRMPSGPGSAVPNFWMAKLGAYLDR